MYVYFPGKKNVHVRMCVRTVYVCFPEKKICVAGRKVVYLHMYIWSVWSTKSVVFVSVTASLPWQLHSSWRHCLWSESYCAGCCKNMLYTLVCIKEGQRQTRCKTAWWNRGELILAILSLNEQICTDETGLQKFSRHPQFYSSMYQK